MVARGDARKSSATKSSSSIRSSRVRASVYDARVSAGEMPEMNARRISAHERNLRGAREGRVGG